MVFLGELRQSRIEHDLLAADQVNAALDGFAQIARKKANRGQARRGMDPARKSGYAQSPVEGEKVIPRWAEGRRKNDERPAGQPNLKGAEVEPAVTALDPYGKRRLRPRPMSQTIKPTC
jgi:hypothetical protein